MKRAPKERAPKEESAEGRERRRKRAPRRREELREQRAGTLERPIRSAAAAEILLDRVFRTP
jgi:hypothetical protein